MLELKALLLTQGMHGMISQTEGLAKALKLNFKHQKIKLKPIYLDNNSTTMIDPRVLDKMIPYMKDNFGNASSRFVEILENDSFWKYPEDYFRRMILKNLWGYPSGILWKHFGKYIYLLSC